MNMCNKHVAKDFLKHDEDDEKVFYTHSANHMKPQVPSD